MEIKIKYNQIAIIGMGHLGTALFEGLTRSRKVSRSCIRLSNSSKQNAQTVKNADIVFLTIKKSHVVEVFQDIKDDLKTDAVIVSSVAGLWVSEIKKMLKTNHQIVRIMPNIAISIGKGIIGIYASTPEVHTLMSSLGRVVEVDDEQKLDILTVASGCGSGVTAYMIQSLIQSYIGIGLTKFEALDVALQTIYGTYELLKEQNMSPEQLLTQVATKGGITELIVHSFNEHNLSTIIAQGLQKGKQTLLKY